MTDNEPQTDTEPSLRLLGLYQRFGDELTLFLRGLLRDPDATGEALQVTFRKALESLDHIKPETERGWLFTTAYHTAMEQKRRLKRDGRLLRNAAHNSAPDASHETPSDSLIRHETVALVRSEIDRLPDEQRDIVEARLSRQLTFQEIADETGLPLGTVLTRMRLALDKLSRTLRHLNTPDEP